jgi:hypothetical protein
MTPQAYLYICDGDIDSPVLTHKKMDWPEKYPHWQEIPLVMAQEHVGFVDSKLNPIQRAWVGMPDDEKEKFVIAYYPSNWDRKTAVALMNNYEAYLKERNT